MTALAHSHDTSLEFSRGTILVADDDPISVRIISIALENAGWLVETASNGQQALDIATSTPVDAIILDMRMPQLDGYEVCLELVRQGLNIPILVITGCLGDNEPLGYLNVRRTLNKPVNLKDLMDFVEGARQGPAWQADNSSEALATGIDCHDFGSDRIVRQI